jgi:quinol monooxygenase YgiN
MEYRLIRSQKNAGEFVVVERYESAEAFEKHRNNPETRKLMGSITELLSDKPQFRFYDEIALG